MEPNSRRTKHTFQVAIVVLVIVKVLLSAFTPFSGDFLDWIQLGRAVTSGQRYFGIYTGPAYIYAAPYSLWLTLTKDVAASYRLEQLFFSGLGNAGSAVSAEMFGFTLVMKIPLLVADISTILLIMLVAKRISKSSYKASLAGLLWASSPLVFLLETSTTVEIFPALLILLAVSELHRLRVKAGSCFLALGSLIRLAPLLFGWIYALAFLRLRQFKNLIRFVGVQVLFFGLGALFLIYTSGADAILRILGQRPGIIIPEILTTIGPPDPNIGLGVVAYFLVAYFFTRPAIWVRRDFGIEALGFFAAYFALTSFHIPFLLWMIPIYVVYSVTTRFGAGRFLLSTLLGLLFYIFEAPGHLSQEGRAVFFIPNINEAWVSASASLYSLSSLPILPDVFHSLFAASLLFTLVWSMREAWRSEKATKPG